MLCVNDWSNESLITSLSKIISLIAELQVQFTYQSLVFINLFILIKLSDDDYRQTQSSVYSVLLYTVQH